MSQTPDKKTLSRRHFLRISGLTGTALCLGFFLPASGEEAEVVNALDAAATEIEMNPWILIDTSGKITLMNHRAEMGQGIYQAVPQIIAEELEVDLDKVNLVFAQGNQKKYG